MKQKQLLKRVAALLLVVAMLIGDLPLIGTSAEASIARDITFHFKNVKGWENVGAWIYEGKAFDINVTPADKCVTNGEKQLWPGAKCEDEGNGWVKITATFTGAKSDAVLLFNNWVADNTINDTTTQEDLDKLVAAGVTCDSTKKEQSPNIMLGVPRDGWVTFDSDEYWIEWDGVSTALMGAEGTGIHTEVPVSYTVSTTSAYSVVGSPELGIAWDPAAEYCFVQDHGNGKYSKKLVATADGDFEFKILQDGPTFAWSNQLQLGTGLFVDNASQFKLTGVVTGDEFVVTFNPATGDVVVKKDGVEVEYLVRWSTTAEAPYDYLTKAEALKTYSNTYVFGEYQYRILGDESVAILKYTGNSAEVIVPEEIDGHVVTMIENEAFANKRNLKSVEIPTTVTNIGRNSFMYCTKMESISLPNGLKSVGAYAFYNCYSLNNINIPSSVLLIDEYAFASCKRLKVVTIPEGIQELGRGIFNGCTRLYAVNLPKSLTKIKSDAFANCTNLTSIKIPSNVRSLGAGIFRDCSKLTEIKLPASLEYIQKDAFSRIPNLYNILVDEENNKYCSVNGILFSKNPYSLIACPAKKSFEAGVCGKNAKYALIAEGGTLVISGTNAMSDYDINYADDGAFGSSIANMNDYSLGVYGDDEAPNSPFALDYRIKDIVILGNKMTKIGDLAFYGCAGLTKLTIPSCITTIGTSAFYKCENLTDVEIGSEVTNIGDSAFDGCPNLTIHCEENSVAHKYAMLNSINYKIFAKNYIVSFDVNGGANTSVDNKEVEENTAVGTLPTTNREGYIFKGWYTDKTAGTKVTEETVVKADMTVYAQWEKETTPIENAEVNVLSTDIIYDGTAKEGIVQVIVDNKVLKKDTDYTVTYADNTKVGTAKVTITGVGNYIGTVAKTYEIKPATIKVENVTLKATEYIYDGSAKQADVIVKVGAATLVKDTDYKVAYANNTEAGTAAVTITGMGNYTGLVEKEYIIKPCSVESAELTLEATEVTFNGMEQSPAVQVILGEKVLVNGTDYNVTYTNNKDKGLATVTVTGTGNYNGNIAKEYKINAYNIENAEVNILSTDVVYDGAVKNVKIQVIANNRVLKEVEDYSILYLTNTNAGTAKFGLVGHGNYTGSVVKTFEIKQATIKKSDVTVEATEYIYDGKEKKPSATVTINGKTLKKDVDYIVTYEENIEVGYGRTIITGIGNYAGTVERMLRIKKASLSSVELAKTEFIFSEEDQEPKLTVKSGNKKLKEDEDYEVYYKKNYGIGTAKVIVIGIGNYTGKLTESFKIMPQEVKEVTQTGSKSAASITLTWTATPGVSGYEIYRSTSKNGDYTIVKYQSANTYKDVKLEADTKYYYKVRAYRTVNKVKYYGDFSKVISAETIVAVPEFTLTASEEAVTVNWDKSKGADGYEVYMASSKKATFKNIKTANTNGRKHKKTGLKSGKTYYFKVRAYQLDASGKKIYSAFSEIQEVTVK